MDLFSLPPVVRDKKLWDTLIFCVDRHSGWIVAVPERKVGLTGAKVALAMVQHQWRPFGVPSVVTSDQGSQFIGSWWQNMCALLGIRHAMSHAYHHRANGRAERGGQQLFERLRRMQIEGEFSWVEALPQVLDRLHDTPGEGGLSPYQVLFGKERPLGWLPYEPPTECEDAISLFKSMKSIDERVASVLNQNNLGMSALSIRAVHNPRRFV